MRNYFTSTLKGGSIFLWWLLYLVSIAAVVAFGRGGSVTAETIIDGGLWTLVWRQGLAALIILLFGLTFLFFFVRAVLRSISYRDQAPTVDFDPARFFGLAVKGVLLTVITFGIYYPWFIASLLRYFAANTSYRDEPFGFAGKGMTLFGIIVLAAVLPYGIMFALLVPVIMSAMTMDYGMFLFWICLITFLALVVAGAYTYLETRWAVDLRRGGKKIVFRSPVAGGIGFFMGQLLLSIITLGLYLPAAYIRMWRYVAAHTIIGEQQVESRLGMTPQLWPDYFYILGQSLLTVITAGIYGGWAIAGIMRRLIGRTYLEEVGPDAQPAPMPLD